MTFFTSTIAAIGGAFSAVSNFIGGLGVFGKLALQAAVGVGGNLLAKSLAGKPAEPQFSVTTTLQAGGDLSRSIVFGRYPTAGSLAYPNTWGRLGETDNAFLTQVIALSDLPSRALAEIWVNGELCTLGAVPHPEYGLPVTEYFKDGHDNLWIKFFDGTQTVADPFLLSRVSSAERPYTEKRVGRGVTYAIVTSLVTKNLFSGTPAVRFVLEGARLYDPSRDSTVGGVGPHRWGDPSTWGGDGDFLPAVQIYNLLRGISYGGRWLYGIQGMSAARLPVAHWIGQIEKCRAGIESADGVVPTYRSGGEVEVNVALGDAIEALLTTCQGRISEIGGVYKLHVGAPDAPVMSFTDDDILSTEEQSFTPFFGLADTINGISARYPSPADGWNMKVAPPLYRADLEAIAGNRRLMADVSLDFVPYAEQVQRLMKSALEEAQRARRHTFVLPPQFWPLEPGDIVAWTSARNGYVAKLFRVDGVVDRGNLDVMVDVTEVDPADYDWDSEADFKPPVSGSLGPVRPTPQVIVDWFAQPWQIEDASGTGRRPAIRLSWDGDQPDVDAVAFEVALAETLEVIYRGRTDEPEAGAIVISQGLLPNEDYLVRGRYVPRSDRDTAWSGWLPVRTLNIAFTGSDILDATITELKLADRAVSSAKIQVAAVIQELIASNAVVASKIADLAITQQKVADNAISVAKIVNAAVTGDKLAPGSVAASKVVDGAINGAKLADAAVTELKLADAAVAAAKIATGAVLAAKLADNAVTVGKIVDGAVTDLKLAANAVTEAKIATGAVLAAKLADNAVTVDKILNNAVTTAKISDGAVNAGKLATNAVTELKLADSAVAAAKIATGAVLAAKLADAAVETAKLASNAVTSDKILADAVIADKIAANAVTTAKISAGAVTATEIAASAVTAIKISAGAIVADKIAANAVSFGKIAANSITVRELTLSNFDNLLSDPYFDAEMGVSWFTSNPGAQLTTSNISSYGPRVLQFLPGANASTVYSPVIKVRPGEFYRFDVVTRWFGSTPFSGIRADVEFMNKDSSATISSTTDIVALPSDANEVLRSQDFEVPSGAYTMRVRFFTGTSSLDGDWRIHFAGIFKRQDATLIVDGAIIADKIAANAVTSVKINAGAVTATEIAAGAIVAGKIATAAVTADTIAAGNVVATKIASDAVTADKIAANAVTTAKINAGAVTATEIAAGAIVAEKIATNAVTTAKINAGAVTAAEIATGAVTALKVAARAITTEKLVLTNFSNLVPDPTFDSNLGESWTSSVSALTSTSGLTSFGTRVLLLNEGLTVGSLVRTPNIAVTPNEIYRLTFAGARFGASTPNVTLRCDVNFYNRNNDSVSLQAIDLDINVSSEQVVSRDVTAPSAATYCHVRIYLPSSTPLSGSTWRAHYVALTRKSSAELIVDGAITADKIAANAVEASKIAAGSIIAGKIATNAVTTTTIAAGAVTANELAANSVIAAKIAAGAILAASIGTHAVTADKIAANAVTADKILAGSVTAAKISVGSLAAISAVLGNVDISNANIGSLIVGESNIGFKSMTEPAAISNAGSYSGLSRNYTTVATLNTPKLVGGFVQVDGSFTLSTNGATSSRTNIQARIFRVDTGQEIWVSQLYTLQGQNQGPNSANVSIVRDFAMDTGESPGSSGQYVLQILNSNMGGTATASWSLVGKLLLWKK
jgi:hypothetical protein